MSGPCLTENLRDICDTRKIDIIKHGLNRLIVDIATFQETHLTEEGTLKKKDYKFYWLGRSQGTWNELRREEHLSE